MRALHWWRLLRGTNLLIIAITQVATFCFLDAALCLQSPFNSKLLMVVASTICTAAAGYIINDYFDVQIDAINKPERMVVGRYLKRGYAIALHVVLSFIALAIAYKVSRSFALVSVVIGLGLWIYSAKLKYYPLVGNIVVSLLLGASVLVVYYAGKPLWMPWMYAYAGFAFLTGLIREITKDTEDLKGDVRHGARTLPAMIGIAKTKQIIGALLILTLIGLALAGVYLAYDRKRVLLVYLLAALVFPLIATYRTLIRADQKRDFTIVSRYIKIVMVSGILSMALRCTQ